MRKPKVFKFDYKNCTDAVLIKIWEKDGRSSAIAKFVDMEGSVIREEDNIYHDDQSPFQLLADVLDDLRYGHARNCGIFIHSTELREWLIDRRMKIKLQKYEGGDKEIDKRKRAHQRLFRSSKDFDMPALSDDPRWTILRRLMSYRSSNVWWVNSMPDIEEMWKDYWGR